jgi:hypothetical protein
VPAGQTSGGLVNISIRSGTNKLRGSFTCRKMRPDWMATPGSATHRHSAQGLRLQPLGQRRAVPSSFPRSTTAATSFFMWSYEVCRPASAADQPP